MKSSKASSWSFFTFPKSDNLVFFQLLLFHLYILLTSAFFTYNSGDLLNLPECFSSLAFRARLRLYEGTNRLTIKARSRLDKCTIKTRSVHINGIQSRCTFIGFLCTIIMQPRCTMTQFDPFCYGCDHQHRTLRRMTTARIDIPLYPELAKEQTNKDGNLTSMEVRR